MSLLLCFLQNDPLLQHKESAPVSLPPPHVQGETGPAPSARWHGRGCTAGRGPDAVAGWTAQCPAHSSRQMQGVFMQAGNGLDSNCGCSCSPNCTCARLDAMYTDSTGSSRSIQRLSKLLTCTVCGQGGGRRWSRLDCSMPSAYQQTSTGRTTRCAFCRTSPASSD